MLRPSDRVLNCIWFILNRYATLPLSRFADHRICGGVADFEPGWTEDLPVGPLEAQRSGVPVSAHLYLWRHLHRGIRVRGIAQGYLAGLLCDGHSCRDGADRRLAASGAGMAWT